MLRVPKVGVEAKIRGGKDQAQVLAEGKGVSVKCFKSICN